MNTMDIIEAMNGLDESLLAEALEEETAEKCEGMKSEAADCPAAAKKTREKRGSRSLTGKRSRWSIIAACFLIAALTGATLSKSRAAEDPEAETHQWEYFLEMSRLQSHASSMAQRIYGRFLQYEVGTGRMIYPDDFGDCYIDGEILVLCLKDPDEAMTEKYLGMLGEGRKWVRIRPVEYSRNELQAIADELAKYLQSQNIPLRFYGVDVVINGVDFGVAPEAVERTEELIREHYPGIPYNVQGCGPIVFTESNQSDPLSEESYPLSERAEQWLAEKASRERAWEEKMRTEYAAYWATDGTGGEYATPAGMQKAKEQMQKETEIRTKLEAYFAEHPDGKLAQHFSGIWHPNALDDVLVRLDDIEDPELLQELESVGIVSDYQLEKWAGTNEAGEAAAKQLQEAYAALKAKVHWNEEEKLLMKKYRPEIASYVPFTGMIDVILHCDTPWYQQVSMEEMNIDQARAVALFEKYIGKYEFVIYGFPQ